MSVRRPPSAFALRRPPSALCPPPSALRPPDGAPLRAPLMSGIINICIGLAPGRTSDVGRRTGAMSGKVFYGWTDGGTAEKKRRKNFVLGWPAKFRKL